MNCEGYGHEQLSEGLPQQQIDAGLEAQSDAKAEAGAEAEPKAGLLFEVQAYLAAQNSQLVLCRHDHVAVLKAWRHRLVQSQGHMHGIIQPPLHM